MLFNAICDLKVMNILKDKKKTFNKDLSSLSTKRKYSLI